MNCITFTQSQARERKSGERRMSGWVVLVRRWCERKERENLFYFIFYFFVFCYDFVIFF